MDLVRGGIYKFRTQPELLKYTGVERGWHQFERLGQQGIWCELLESDLWMIEAVNDEVNDGH